MNALRRDFLRSIQLEDCICFEIFLSSGCLEAISVGISRGVWGFANFGHFVRLKCCACLFVHRELNLLQVNTYSADVKNFENIKVAIEAAVSDSGVVEVLVLSHGVSIVSSFEDQTVQDFDHIIDTNLKGNLHTIKAALPHIEASEGSPASISIFSSQAGQVRFICPSKLKSLVVQEKLGGCTIADADALLKWLYEFSCTKGIQVPDVPMELQSQIVQLYSVGWCSMIATS